MGLRPYQLRAIEAAREAYRRGARSICIVAPTGAGKTRLAVELSRSALGKGGSILWLAHREELIRQAVDALRREGVDPGIVAPWSPLRASLVQVASVQTLVARGTRPEASLLVADEAHHHLAEQWGEVAAAYPHAVRIGLTATPERQDGVAIGNLFDSLVVVAQPRELIESGYLVPVTVLRPTHTTRHLAEDPVEAWRRWGDGGKAIVFPASVRAAKDIVHRFEACGVPARAITGTTKPEDRELAIERFRSGSIRVLVGVHTLTEGLDVPDASVAILARGFASQGAYIQAVGRVMRPAPGKASATVIDLMGASIDHGLPDEDRVYSLEGRPIRIADGAPPITQCEACGRVFRADAFRDATCPACGHVRRGRLDPKVKRELVEKACSAHCDTRRTETLARLVETARKRGHKVGWAFIQFKLRYKHWPSEDMKRSAGLG